MLELNVCFSFFFLSRRFPSVAAHKKADLLEAIRKAVIEVMLRHALFEVYNVARSLFSPVLKMRYRF